MNVEEIVDGLNALGFTGGYAVGEEPAKIILWENDVEQPSYEEIAAASVNGAYNREYAIVEEARLQGYQRTSDPIMAQFLRGEKTEQEWLDAVEAVKLANPYPEKPTA